MGEIFQLPRTKSALLNEAYLLICLIFLKKIGGKNIKTRNDEFPSPPRSPFRSGEFFNPTKTYELQGFQTNI